MAIVNSGAEALMSQFPIYDMSSAGPLDSNIVTAQSIVKPPPGVHIISTQLIVTNCLGIDIKNVYLAHGGTPVTWSDVAGSKICTYSFNSNLIDALPQNGEHTIFRGIITILCSNNQVYSTTHEFYKAVTTPAHNDVIASCSSPPVTWTPDMTSAIVGFGARQEPSTGNAKILDIVVDGWYTSAYDIAIPGVNTTIIYQKPGNRVFYGAVRINGSVQDTIWKYGAVRLVLKVLYELADGTTNELKFSQLFYSTKKLPEYPYYPIYVVAKNSNSNSNSKLLIYDTDTSAVNIQFDIYTMPRGRANVTNYHVELVSNSGYSILDPSDCPVIVMPNPNNTQVLLNVTIPIQKIHDYWATMKSDLFVIVSADDQVNRASGVVQIDYKVLEDTGGQEIKDADGRPVFVNLTLDTHRVEFADANQVNLKCTVEASHSDIVLWTDILGFSYSIIQSSPWQVLSPDYIAVQFSEYIPGINQTSINNIYTCTVTLSGELYNDIIAHSNEIVQIMLPWEWQGQYRVAQDSVELQVVKSTISVPPALPGGSGREDLAVPTDIPKDLTGAQGMILNMIEDPIEYRRVWFKSGMDVQDSYTSVNYVVKEDSWYRKMRYPERWQRIGGPDALDIWYSDDGDHSRYVGGMQHNWYSVDGSTGESIQNPEVTLYLKVDNGDISQLVYRLTVGQIPYLSLDSTTGQIDWGATGYKSSGIKAFQDLSYIYSQTGNNDIKLKVQRGIGYPQELHNVRPYVTLGAGIDGDAEEPKDLNTVRKNTLAYVTDIPSRAGMWDLTKWYVVELIHLRSDNESDNDFYAKYVPVPKYPVDEGDYIVHVDEDGNIEYIDDPSRHDRNGEMLFLHSIMVASKVNREDTTIYHWWTLNIELPLKDPIPTGPNNSAGSRAGEQWFAQFLVRNGAVSNQTWLRFSTPSSSTYPYVQGNGGYGIGYPQSLWSEDGITVRTVNEGGQFFAYHEFLEDRIILSGNYAPSNDYEDYINKPKINGVTLIGDKSSYDIHVAPWAQRVPTGGTTGQVLSKASDADNDVEWASMTPSTYNDLTIWTLDKIPPLVNQYTGVAWSDLTFLRGYDKPTEQVLEGDIVEIGHSYGLDEVRALYKVFRIDSGTRTCDIQQVGISNVKEYVKPLGQISVDRLTEQVSSKFNVEISSIQMLQGSFEVGMWVFNRQPSFDAAASHDQLYYVDSRVAGTSECSLTLMSQSSPTLWEYTDSGLDYTDTQITIPKTRWTSIQPPPRCIVNFKDFPEVGDTVFFKSIGNNYQAGGIVTSILINTIQIIYFYRQSATLVHDVTLTGIGDSILPLKVTHPIPSGGVDKQVLGKLSSNDYDIGWVDPPGSAGGLDVAYTTTSDMPDTIGATANISIGTITPAPDASSVGKYIVDQKGTIGRITGVSGGSVQAVVVSTGLPEAPVNGILYGRQDRQWVAVPADTVNTWTLWTASSSTNAAYSSGVNYQFNITALTKLNGQDIKTVPSVGDCISANSVVLIISNVNTSSGIVTANTVGITNNISIWSCTLSVPETSTMSLSTQLTYTLVAGFLKDSFAVGDFILTDAQTLYVIVAHNTTAQTITIKRCTDTDAPSDSKVYGRQNNAWVDINENLTVTHDTSLSGDGTTSSPLSVVSNRVVYTQTTSSAVWTITHNLGFKYVSVLSYDSSDNLIVGILSYPSANQCVITFTEPQQGTAVIRA